MAPLVCVGSSVRQGRAQQGVGLTNVSVGLKVGFSTAVVRWADTVVA